MSQTLHLSPIFYTVGHFAKTKKGQIHDVTLLPTETECIKKINKSNAFFFRIEKGGEISHSGAYRSEYKLLLNSRMWLSGNNATETVSLETKWKGFCLPNSTRADPDIKFLSMIN